MFGGGITHTCIKNVVIFNEQFIANNPLLIDVKSTRLAAISKTKLRRYSNRVII